MHKAAEIISLFEEYLFEKGVVVPNKERETAMELDPHTSYAIIYGEEYYDLEEKIKKILER